MRRALACFEEFGGVGAGGTADAARGRQQDGLDFGVGLNTSSKTRPYLARVSRGGKKVILGRFVTAEEPSEWGAPSNTIRYRDSGYTGLTACRLATVPS